jgi:outer membrane protein assembly factor BamB
VVEVEGERLVYFGAGKTMHALRADDGSEVWSHELGALGDDDEPTEIESSPVVADGKVVFGYDAHDRPGFATGVVALDAATGDEVWEFDPDQGERICAPWPGFRAGRRKSGSSLGPVTPTRRCGTEGKLNRKQSPLPLS